MTLKSMTGFARRDGALDGATWHWEARSVNNRGLDLRLRLPPGYEILEPAVRELAAKRISRGSVSINLRAERSAGEVRVRLNETALAETVKAAERVRALTGGPPPSTDGLLAIKGILEIVDEADDEAATARINEAMLKDLAGVLDAMVAARESEGRRLKSVLDAQLAEVARLVALIEAAPCRRPEAIRARLSELVSRLHDASGGQPFDTARLHQEAVLIATRLDVEEELKRLAMHVQAAHELLASDAPVGRKLDFLAQEFNREANTLTSKSGDAEITQHGLSLKTVIDQFREQVQNIE